MSTADEFRRDIAAAEGISEEEVAARIQQNQELGDISGTPPLPPVTYQARGDARAFSSRYKVDNHSYPDDLFSNQRSYGGNYTIFYINQLNDSKLKAGDKDVNGNPIDFITEDLPPRDRGDTIALGLTPEQLSATVTGQSAIAALAAGGIGAGTLGQVGTAAAVNAGGSYVTATMATSATRATKRLKTAIALHTPNQLQIAYNTQWSEEDTAGFAMTQGIGASIINALPGGQGGVSDIADAGQGGIANLFLSKSPSASAVSAATGLAANPKKEQLFKGVDFRTFTMEYQFFPRSENEANNVMNIIRQFKYHMHPEFKDSRNFVYLYPSEFDIYHYKDGVENLNLHRHTSCVLTNMSINYTPNGLYSTFSNGMSTQINIALTFKELSLLTKEKIMDGM
jgi:hypothetical protein